MAQLSNLIKKLQEIEKEYGNIDVVCYGMNNDIVLYNDSHIKVTNKVILVKKDRKGKIVKKKIDTAHPWDYSVKDRKQNLKDGRILTNKKIVKL